LKSFVQGTQAIVQVLRSGCWVR